MQHVFKLFILEGPAFVRRKCGFSWSSSYRAKFAKQAASRCLVNALTMLEVENSSVCKSQLFHDLLA